MSNEDLHYIQLAILKKLLFSEGLKFSELKPFEDIETNKLSFHIEKLIQLGHVIKDGIIYKLTESGKEFANRMDTDNAQMKKQGKIGIIMCCMKTDGDEPEFLIYTRKKHPFFGSQGYSSGKVWYGERTWETAIRELKEETNLDAAEKPTLFTIEHHLVYDKNSKELREDKYFYFYRFINPKGNLKSNEEGSFEWVKESELEKYFVKPFVTVERLMYITKRIKDVNHELTFEDIEHFADNF
jgi:8-oxo-dGTP pyrophosphatase MutT (NUDIX family)